MLRSIETVFPGAPFHMVGDGFRVSNHFPSATDLNKRMSPFFLLDYHPPFYYPPTRARRGVGAHPHRGFETVTIAYEGAVAHHDSAGNRGVIRPGDVQWMTAGAGVLHNEYHEKSFGAAGGVMHMMQIWVNLPRKHKGTAPKYQELTSAGIPAVSLDGGGRARVIAGSFQDARGPASVFSPVQMLDLALKAGERLRLPVPRDHNAALVVLSGGLRLNGGARAAARDSVVFKNDGDEILLEATEDAAALFLSGAPLEEPLVHYGPFVMNTIEEINQAVEDYRAGKFGRLED
ncbi:MAG: pirin family protein [Elusimicrobiota bacterium]